MIGFKITSLHLHYAPIICFFQIELKKINGGLLKVSKVNYMINPTCTESKK